MPLCQQTTAGGGSRGADVSRAGASHIEDSVSRRHEHVVLEPLDYMSRLAALVPPPRMHLTRYHGVFAPHSKLRAAITPAKRGKGAHKKNAEEGVDKPATPRHVAMTWAQRLKRVFGVDIEACARCSGRLKVIASIEDPAVITRILAHLDRASGEVQPELAPISAYGQRGTVMGRCLLLAAAFGQPHRHDGRQLLAGSCRLFHSKPDVRRRRSLSLSPSDWDS